MTASDPMTPRTLEILLALADRPRHGYGIRQEVESRTERRVVLRSGTLYEAIQRLEGQAWIESTDAPSDEDESGGPERRYWALTEAGRRALGTELRRLRSILDAAALKAPGVEPI